jgi:hypothetical protein
MFQGNVFLIADPQTRKNGLRISVKQMAVATG